VRLYDGFSVILGITPLSGRLFLKTLQEGSSAGGEEVESEGSSARLVEASERINSNPSTLVEVLQNLRFGGVIEELEQKAGYLGLHCMRRVPLRHEGKFSRAVLGDLFSIHLLMFPSLSPPRYASISSQLFRSSQVFWICPLRSPLHSSGSVPFLLHRPEDSPSGHQSQPGLYCICDRTKWPADRDDSVDVLARQTESLWS